MNSAAVIEDVAESENDVRGLGRSSQVRHEGQVVTQINQTITWRQKRQIEKMQNI